MNYFEVWLHSQLMPVFNFMLSHIVILEKSPFFFLDTILG